ncbi:MAG TPA: hypothetical protein PL110_11870 [Candidatus Eremiobacteraeota bacterium]|nr:MAG: hypothetical protein BWY64_02358 [bacterium ADurb.Bin363]HPZ08806.1 hypothetical protein [Candidatus Eremiobacteraeota bacterium]
MNSYLMDDFLSYFEKLPQKVKKMARKNYRLWRQNPYHPGLQFKQIHSRELIFSVRVGKGWRALSLKESDDIFWFWIGSYADYDKLISQF